MAPDPFDDDDGEGFGSPLPPDDRIWRHPSEVGGFIGAARRRREISNGRLIGFTAAASLLGSVITVGALAAGGAFGRTVIEAAPAGTTTVTVTSVIIPAEGANWPEIVQQLAPSVLRIESSTPAVNNTGSAVAYRVQDGGTYLVTSRDLVHNAEKVMMVVDDDKLATLKVIGSDQYTNLAVLFAPGRRITPPDFGEGNLLAGADALVLGAAPPGADSPTVAKALIGSLNNTQRARSGIEVRELLRTDANITADVKGGALIDTGGAMVGLLAVMASDETGVERFAYALPIGAMRATADSLIATGFPTQVWMGISGTDLPAGQALALGVSGGAALDNVAINSPAAHCGLQAGDAVIALNTTTIDSMTGLVMALRELRPGDVIAVEFLRNGATQRCYAELARPPGASIGVTDGSVPTSAVASTSTPKSAGAAPTTVTSP